MLKAEQQLRAIARGVPPSGVRIDSKCGTSSHSADPPVPGDLVRRSGFWKNDHLGWSLDMAFPIPCTRRLVFEVAGHTLSLDRVSGDYAELYLSSNGLLTSVLLDAAGHGDLAALMISEIEVCISQLARQGRMPHELLTAANQVLARKRMGSFVTAAVFQVDVITRRVLFSGAGHAAFKCDTSGRVREIDSTSVPLGILDDETFESVDCGEMQERESLLLISDGVYETMCKAGRPLGLDASLKILEQSCDTSARTTVDELEALRCRHQASAPLHDDVSVLLIRLTTGSAISAAALSTVTV